MLRFPNQSERSLVTTAGEFLASVGMGVVALSSVEIVARGLETNHQSIGRMVGGLALTGLGELAWAAGLESNRNRS